MNLSKWLKDDCGAFDVIPVTVTIGEEHLEIWEGCCYKQEFSYQRGMDAVTRGEKKEGDKYVEESIYCLGNLPLVYKPKNRRYPIDNVCFVNDNLDWYIAGYILKENITETNKNFHPFGESFILKPWWEVLNGKNIGKIDQYEKYKRYKIFFKSCV